MIDRNTNMGNQKCRVCGQEIFAEPLLHYDNMPSAAQYLPSARELKIEKGVALEVCQCSGCGLVQLGNDPVPYFKEVIRASAFSDEMKAFRHKQFKDFIRQNSLKGKTVIEIGCGRGEYLSIMNRAGAKVSGLEESAESVAYCIGRGLKVSKGFIDKASACLPKAPYDAFYMMSFLEHLPDPSSTLKGIYNNLTADGIGLVEVPNFDLILRQKLWAEFIGDHLCYFTKETLTSTLSLNGFQILDCSEVWHDYIISAIVKKRERYDLSQFKEQRRKIKIEIEGYLRRFRNKGVAIWGAGHQALAVIALTEIAGKIKYVVDSATFKQGKFTPATHLPIVQPDLLNSDPVEAIIIMAASYSDEVAMIIRQKYAKTIKIAILRANGLEEIDG